MDKIEIDLEEISTPINIDLKDKAIPVPQYITPQVSDNTLIYDTGNVNEGVLEL